MGCLAPPIRAQEPPPDLARRIAHQESATEAARDQYDYRQTVEFSELDSHGAATGQYREVRDVILSPDHQRTEQLIGTPLETLKRLKMTDEDFQDIRGIQPFVMTEDQLWNYETVFRGDENIDGVDCWVLRVRPRQILDGQRLFDGMIWAGKKDYSIVRVEGQAVPQIFGGKAENLFPRFTTVREIIDGQHRFPTYTYADDTLPFRNGLQRVRLTIRYSQYKRFGAESVIKFEKP
ncbi:MAG TPA: hypothetical protein VMT86_17985 [Bryobacteraceae bacterium]|nr:hypothetical protein [Bryobacteraceae bacterium]